MLFMNRDKDDEDGGRSGMPNEEELSVILPRGQTWCKDRQVYMVC